jgi:hypothetical protein
MGSEKDLNLGMKKNNIILLILFCLTVISLDKRNYIAHFNLCNLFFVKGNFKGALAQYSITISCNSSFSDLKDYRYFISVSDAQNKI